MNKNIYDFFCFSNFTVYPKSWSMHILVASWRFEFRFRETGRRNQSLRHDPFFLNFDADVNYDDGSYGS